MFESRRRANAILRRNRLPSIMVAVVAVIFLIMGVTGIVMFEFLGLFLLLIAGILYHMALRTAHRTWGRGAEGEEKVARILATLGESYGIVHDVHLPGNRGNIDHVVIGPNGVFAVETKNHKGLISCQGDCWHYQYQVQRRRSDYFDERIGNPSNQIKRNAALLRNFIKKRLELDVFIDCIVVFANDKARLAYTVPPWQLLGRTR